MDMPLNAPTIILTINEGIHSFYKTWQVGSSALPPYQNYSYNVTLKFLKCFYIFVYCSNSLSICDSSCKWVGFHLKSNKCLKQTNKQT